MKTPQQIIDMIQEDAPCVCDILHEKLNVARPTPDQLLEALTEYSGDNHDVHYWSGRYAQMKEEDEEFIRVPFTEADINDLQEGEHFTWTFGGRQLFIFNTDSTPQYDPDSDEYDPSLTI